MNDPYYTLGIPSTATDDEVKQAYRKLAKKYHPDANPGNKQAEKKMQDINAAYDEIMRQRSDHSYGRTGYGSQGGYGSYNSYGQNRQYSSGGNSSYFSAARNYISFGRNQEALNALSNIPSSQRNGEWYYLSAVANAQMGNRVQALTDIQTAVRLEPGNLEYQDFLDRLQNSGRNYTSRAGNYQTIDFGSTGNWCCSLCLINMLLNFCCCRRC